MFGFYVPKVVYDMIPYAYAMLGVLGVSTSTMLGQACGILLIFLSMVIMKMRS